MYRRIIFIISVLFYGVTFLPAQNEVKLSAEEIKSYKQQSKMMISYLEGTLNFLGDPDEVIAEKEIIIKESGVDEEIATKLVDIAANIRQLSDSDIQEAVSTRLLIYAAKLIVKGFDPYQACLHSIVESLSDEEDLLAVLEKLISLHFQKG
jgi:hypothetical protein